tara:strand:+ start:191 stop:337 length:147 start_codon:yes stop_codon:yes gene_type:complete
LKGAAKKKAGVAVINQDFYTKSDGQRTVRSEAGGETVAHIQEKPTVPP